MTRLSSKTNTTKRDAGVSCLCFFNERSFFCLVNVRRSIKTQSWPRTSLTWIQVITIEAKELKAAIQTYKLKSRLPPKCKILMNVSYLISSSVSSGPFNRPFTSIKQKKNSVSFRSIAVYILTDLSCLTFQVSSWQWRRPDLIHFTEHLCNGERPPFMKPANLPSPLPQVIFISAMMPCQVTECLSACLLYCLGLCFPQVCQSQGPCFKFIISCLKDEKPICLSSVWMPL